MDLDKLAHAVIVAREGSLSAAAKQIPMSQSALLDPTGLRKHRISQVGRNAPRQLAQMADPERTGPGPRPTE